jgi:peptidoglycan hydrolase-like protein with peptidoglycan-binding domain
VTAPAGGPPAWRRRARVVGATAALVAVLAVAAVAALGLGGREVRPPTATRSGPAATVPVTRQTLVDAVVLSGQLGYGETTPITSVATGTVTWLPEPGATVNRGEPLLRVDDQPVVLFYGALPMYRALAAGVVGTDVQQFERNLWALGYRDIVVDDTFSAATAAVVKRWQRRLKVPETGTVERASVIYASGPVRVAQRLVRVGASAAADVLSYTGGSRVVTVGTDRSKSAWAKPGVPVDLSVDGGTPVPGSVTGVSEAPAAPTEGGGGPDAGGGVTITIGFSDQAALGTKAGAPVSVRYVRTERKDVLTVPVNALLALAEGGYGVEVVADGRSRIVTVEVGLFAGGRVEVRGEGLVEGAAVGVPG